MKHRFSNTYKTFALVLLAIFTSFQFASAKEGGHGGEEGKFKPGPMMLHHVKDSYGWEFAHGVKLPLPVIIYSENGLDVFLSNAIDEAKPVDEHSSGHSEGGHKEAEEHKGIHYDAVLERGETVYAISHGKVVGILKGGEVIGVYDFSITKNVMSMLISVILLFFVFLSVAKGFKKNKDKAPKGLQSFFEPIIVYIRDDVAKPNIGPKYGRYMPLLLTLFFFIWFNNLLGLVPTGANVTGNIAVTAMMAVLVLIVTLISSNGNYWRHILTPPGVPVLLYPILVPVEILGIFTKPFALMIRLFANITAGHIIILSLISLIFVFGTPAVAIASIPFAVAMMFLELFVALLQAYVFTLLAAMYFGQAVEEHH